MQSSFQKFCIVKIPREDNEKTDRLAWIASAESSNEEEVEEPIQVLTRPSLHIRRGLSVENREGP
jgi:hypothetical protein